MKAPESAGIEAGGLAQTLPETEKVSEANVFPVERTPRPVPV